MQKIGFCYRYGLTKAVLNGTKTMTRRVEKELERLVAKYEKHYEEPLRVVEQRWDKTKNRLLIYAHTGIADTDREHVLTLKTRYKLGEFVAVAQNYNDAAKEAEFNTHDEALSLILLGKQREKGWSNKMFVRADLMPHQIKITGIKVERLQDITDEDCLKEGIQSKSSFPRKKSLPYYFDGGKHKWDNSYKSPREAFAALINLPGVGRKGLWEENPWVVVYEFKLLK